MDKKRADARLLVVYVVDDDASIRDSLALMLGLAGYTTRLFADAESFLVGFRPDWAGCVVADLRLPGLSGVELQARVRQRGSAIPFVIITAHGDVPAARAAFRAQAVDFIEKPFDDEVLLAAIRSALNRYDEQGRREAEAAQIAAKLNALSVRERQVLDGLIAGRPNKTIAYDLDISPRTVEIHRANVMTKMAAGSLSELIRMALLAGIIPAK
jgi:two-component system response regulator FixJ